LTVSGPTVATVVFGADHAALPAHNPHTTVPVNTQLALPVTTLVPPCRLTSFEAVA